MRSLSRVPTVVAKILLASVPYSVSASILERVLPLLDVAYPHIEASNISANIAENISNPNTQNRTLATGDRATIGHGTSGTAVLGTADAFGVWVDRENPHEMQSEGVEILHSFRSFVSRCLHRMCRGLSRRLSHSLPRVALKRSRYPFERFPNLRGIVICVLSGLSLADPASAETRLERIFAALAETAFGADVLFMVNVAENTSSFMSQPARLKSGQTVVIGYDTVGAPVIAQSDDFGVTVTAAQALELERGLPPGFYPTGSGLFSIPTGAQLSLYEADRDGQAIATARELVSTRIDGQILTVIGLSPRFAEFGDLALVAGQNSALRAITQIDALQTTVLGAVNNGIAVTNVVAHYGTDVLVPTDLIASKVSRGANMSYMQAATDQVEAVHLVQVVTSGPSVLMNLASNDMDVIGSIRLRVSDQSGSALKVVTTAIGAVNSGIISNTN